MHVAHQQHELFILTPSECVGDERLIGTMDMLMRLATCSIDRVPQPFMLLLQCTIDAISRAPE